MLIKDEILYEIWLNLAAHGNLRLIEKIIKESLSAQIFYENNFKNQKYHASSPLVDENISLSNAERVIEDCVNQNIEILPITHSAYPKRLKAIFNPPRILYIKGKLPEFDNTAITMVGCRHPSTYGIIMSEAISYDLSFCGIIVVSGMAMGIDKHSHIGAINADGITVAVLPRGLDEPYPKQNEFIYEFIQQKGAVISELPPGIGVTPSVFESRNRIMAGLSQGVVVIEARNRSGTQYTVRHALENGRDVFALMGSVNSKNSDYPNRLICEGAIPIRDAEDILSHYINEVTYAKLKETLKNKRFHPKLEESKIITPINPNNKKPKKVDDKNQKNFQNENLKCDSESKNYETLSSHEKTVVKFLAAHDKLHIDFISRESGIEITNLNGIIFSLLIKGIIKQNAGNSYSLNE